MALLIIALVIVALLILAAGTDAGRQLLNGRSEQPPVLPPARPSVLPPAQESPRFRRRPESPHYFKKRVPTPPPKSKEVGPKPQGNGGAVKPKKLHLDFNLPCPVTGRAKLECGCQICRELRKKFGV
jgi:hypothetical protein